MRFRGAIVHQLHSCVKQSSVGDRFTRGALKNKFERELHRARAALLVERIQNTQGTCKRPCRLPKSILSKLSIDYSETWMVEDIECLCAELQLQIVMNRKFATNG